MRKDISFIGQPIFLQVLKFISRTDISQISIKQRTDRYIKCFDGYSHLVTLLYSVFSGCDSLREVVIGLLSNANKLPHLGLDYAVKRSTLSDANKRRSSNFFAEIYKMLYVKYSPFLSDSRNETSSKKRLYVIDSTTVTLFKQILKGAGRNPKQGKKKGGLKVHTLMVADENVPKMIIMTSAATHDHIMLKHLDIPEHSFIVFDKAYVNYAQYQLFSERNISYVTKLKKNAIYDSHHELDIPENADDGIIKDEIIIVHYGAKRAFEHKCRRIAYWDDKKNRVHVFLTNNFELDAEEVMEIYKRRWQIETLFKQLKQNFPLKYFLGDNINAIESQIWVTMIANLLITVIKKRVKRKWSFTGIISLVRLQLMSYICIIKLLEDPEASWLKIIRERKKREENTIFSGIF